MLCRSIQRPARVWAGLAVVALVFSWAIPQTARAEKPTWDLALVIDQSCSMSGNDPDGYALILPAIMADLSSGKDALWMYPQGEIQPFQLVGEQRSAFKNQLDGMMTGGASDSMFSPYFSQASARLSQASAGQDKRLLVTVYDGDERVAAEEAVALAQPVVQAGADGFIIGVGTQIHQPEQGNALNMFGAAHALRVPPGNPTGLLNAYAVILGYLLSSKPPPVGEAAAENIQVAIVPGTSEAWLVVLADEPVRGLKSKGGNPSARAVRTEPESGWTHPGSGRSYQVLHLIEPVAGTWSFEASTGAPKVSWLLLQSFNYGDFAVSFAEPIIAGTPSKVVVTPKGEPWPESVEVEVTTAEGAKVLLKKENGAYTGEFTPETPGPQSITVVATDPNGPYQREETTVIDAVKAVGTLDCSGFLGGVLPAGALLDVTLDRQGGPIPLDAATLEIPGGAPVSFTETSPNRFNAQAPLPMRLGTVEVVATSTAAGITNTCRATFELRPAVSLSVATPSTVEVGPSTLESVFNPFGTCIPADASKERLRDPNQRCSACQMCTGASATLDFTGSVFSPGEPVIGTLSLAGAGLDGVSVFLASGIPGESRLLPGTPLPVEIDPTKSPLLLPIAVCAERCPAGGTHTLELELSFDQVWDSTTGQGPTKVSVKVPLTVEVAPSSFWTCYGWLVVTSVGAMLFILWVYGYIHPLKFPRSKAGSARIPHKRYAVSIGQLAQLKVEAYAASMRTYAIPKRPWYFRDQTVYLDALGNFTERKKAVAAIELRRGSGRPTAWFVPLDGRRWIYAPFQNGDWAAHQGQWLLAPNGSDMLLVAGPTGVEVKLNHVYVPVGGGAAPAPPSAKDFAFLFL